MSYTLLARHRKVIYILWLIGTGVYETHLFVQDTVGLRSFAAGGKLLQINRRMEFVFASHSFDVWESWSLEGSLDVWESWSLALRFFCFPKKSLKKPIWVVQVIIEAQFPTLILTRYTTTV